MDISNWGIGKIMQLPDWCFGRRFPISVAARSVNGAIAWDISEVALPERCVVWEFIAWESYIEHVANYFRLAIGDQLPTAVAMMNALDPLFMGLGDQGAEPRQIRCPMSGNISFRRLRTPIETGNKRLIIEVVAQAAQSSWTSVVIVVSSVPREVPDWLISGRAAGL